MAKARFGGDIRLQDTGNGNAQEKIPYPLKAALSYLHSVGAHRGRKITLQGVARRLLNYHKLSVDEKDLTAQFAVAADEGLVNITESNGAIYYCLNGAGEAALNREGTYRVFEPSRRSLWDMQRDGKYPRDLGQR